MDAETYRQSLEAAKAEMRKLLAQRKEIDDRIGKLAPVIEDLSVLCDEVPAPSPQQSVPSDPDPMGLSDAIRFAFRAVMPESLTPIEVRDKLRDANFDLDKYKNELPPIHNTISRLKDQGEIEEVSRPNGERAYKWISNLKRALLEIEPHTHSTLSDRISGRFNRDRFDGRFNRGRFDKGG